MKEAACFLVSFTARHTNYCLYYSKCDNLSYVSYYKAPNKITSCQVWRIRSLGQRVRLARSRKKQIVFVSKLGTTVTRGQCTIVEF